MRALVPDADASAIGRVPGSSRASADATPLLFKKHLLQPTASQSQTASVLIEPEVSPGHNMLVVLDAGLAEHYMNSAQSSGASSRSSGSQFAIRPMAISNSGQSQNRIRAEARSANQVLCNGLLFRAESD